MYGRYWSSSGIKRITSLAVIALVVIAVCVPQAFAEAGPSEVSVATLGDIYVETPANGGSDDTGDGSQARPFATIAKAMTEVSAGHDVHVGQGEFECVSVGLKPRVSLYGSGADKTTLTGNLKGRVLVIGAGANGTVADVTITGGTVATYDATGGMAVLINGGASPHLLRCKVKANRAAATPFPRAAVWIEDAGSPVFEACVFDDNSSEGYAAAVGVSRVLWSADDVLLVNCLFTRNRATWAGAAVLGVNGAKVTVRNCTIAGNTSNYGVVRTNSPAIIRLQNCVVWGNSSGVYGPNQSATYSDIQGGMPGLGNVSTDPLFRNAPAGDFRLSAQSVGTDNATSTAAPTTDLLGVARPQGAKVDMGAYEWFTPRTAVPDSITTSEGTPVEFDVLGNDDPALSGALPRKAVDFSELTPAYGELQTDDTGHVTYTPPTDWNGRVSFTYRADYVLERTAPTTVTIDVAPVNDAPVAVDDTAEARAGSPVTIRPLANDTDIDTPTPELRLADVTTPLVGTVVVHDDGSITYTAPFGFSGVATFTYRVFDGELYSNTATVSVTVNSWNHAPILVPSGGAIPSEAVCADAEDRPGITVATILGDRVEDSDGDAVGMAIDGIHLRDGRWEYSLDGGHTFLPITSASERGALLLRPTDRVRFRAYFKTGSTSLTYRAWDGSCGTAGEYVRISSTGGETAFSSAVDTGSLDVDLPWGDKAGRLWGSDRYATSVATARNATNDWTDVTDLILVSGEDGHAADPLAAASLIWAYRGAPLIQLSSRAVPKAVASALPEIALTNKKVSLHVVGGEAAVPEARIDEIERALEDLGVTVSRDRIEGPDRYSTAAAIARKVVELRGAEMNGDVLIAHGADKNRFFDALALGPVAGANGSPILLTPADQLPAATIAALLELQPKRAVVAGGVACVSERAFASIPVTDTVRWAGRDRFETALQISDNAVSEGLLKVRTVTICAARPDASSLPDGLSSGTISGAEASPLVLTLQGQTPPATEAWLRAHKADIRHAWLIGGARVISDEQMVRLGQLLE